MYKYCFCPVEVSNEDLKHIKLNGEHIVEISDYEVRNRIKKKAEQFINKEGLPVVTLPIGTIVYYKRRPIVTDREYTVYLYTHIVEMILMYTPRKYDGYVELEHYHLYNILILHLWDDTMEDITPRHDIYDLLMK